MKTIRNLIVVAGLMVAVAAPAFAQTTALASGAVPAPETGPVKTFTRPEVTRIVANYRHIVADKGVEERIAVDIGGVKQWITVRGRNRDNPILLVIHGGPASPEMPTDWMLQDGWEDYFTVVQWDQRGSGKTYGANDPAVVGPTLSLDRIVDDAGELVQYLRKTYGKDKVFVLGHSWGSLVGLSLAHKHPEWLYAYVGMGQVISGVENERVGYRLTMEAAQAAGNTQAVNELKSIAPYPEKDGSMPLEKINLERKWSVTYGGLTWNHHDLDFYYDMAKLSPDYAMSDVQNIDKGSALSLPRLLPDLLGFNYTNVTDFKCPIIIFAGRHDFTTPSEVTAAWLKRVHAPSKKIVWFEDSAHMMAVEQPGQMLIHLVEDVRPLAQP
jgi:pimeloyl-ACP methyl ester carboxylesterase